MKKRRALLIGVPEYESSVLNDLPIVRRDIETLHGVLEKSDYFVNSIGMDGISQTGCNKILQNIRKECRQAKGLETLLLYFSGHGIHYQGQDYLIPSDADMSDAEYIEDYLISTDLSQVFDLDRCDANTIIFVIDACREGVKLDFKAPYLNGWSRGERKQASKRKVVLVFACESGQLSQFCSESGYSLFSHAFAQVLDRQHPACSLRDVLEETQVKLNTIISEKGRDPQKIHYSLESAVDDDVASRVICEGVNVAMAGDRTGDPWTQAAMQSPLWLDEEADENSTVTKLKQQVAKIVTVCWRQWQAAIRAFPEDGWRDDRFPVRVLEALELLVFRSDPPVELTAAETALAIAVPFVREAVLASGVVQAARSNPLSLEEVEAKEGFRDALDKLHQGQPRMLRRAKRLQDQGQTEDKNAVMAWLLHRCVMKTLEIWTPESEGGYLSRDLVRALDGGCRCKSRLVRETLGRKQLLELARCMLADLERIDRSDRPDALHSRQIVGDYREEQAIREKVLAYLLKLAGLLAIDVRTLSDVLVDHIGLSDPLKPQEVSQTIDRARWSPSGRGRRLDVTCHHPAIDLTLGEHIQHADAVLTHILRQVGDKRAEMEALVGLPTHLMSDGIVPEQERGGPVYQTPHVNFQLAHDEVRELLMGEQLYGDPTLAIRELYQNALDACRYREARLKYLQQTGKYRGSQGDWEGRILFRQATDENKRVYIECQDNGIGMGMLHLSQCFARAGRRFADLPEFIEEQAQWKKCDPPIQLYPNSQFGVGVLSYFMLADEIEVETCRLDREGKPGMRLQVRIPGSSGLFRVRELGIGEESGTRIRLYLSKTHYQGQIISCIEILRRLLWVAEFPTEVRQGARREVWKVGELKHPYLPSHRCLSVGNNVWWVADDYPGKGCLLSDGLRTEEEQPGFVVNLRYEHYPQLTVDRKKIVKWDGQYLQKLLIQHSEALLTWKYVSWDWLQEFSEKYPKIGNYIVKLLSQDGKKVRLGINKNINISLSSVGCFSPDRVLMNRRPNRFRYYQMPWWLIPYRIFVWQNHGLNFISEECFQSFPKFINTESYYVPNPLDFITFNDNYEYDDKRPGWNLSDKEIVPPANIIFAADYLNESILVTLKRLQNFIPLGLKLKEVNLESLSCINFTKEDLIALSYEEDSESTHVWDKTYIPVAQLILASARLNEPVAITLERFKKFMPLGLEVPSVDLLTLGSLSAEPEDLVCLSIQWDGKYPYPQKEDNILSLSHLIHSAIKLNESIAQTIKRLQRFTPLGLILPDCDVEGLENISLNREELYAFSRFIDQIGFPDPDWEFISSLILAATELDETITDTYERIKYFESIGLEVPKLDPEVLKNFKTAPEDVTALSQSLDWKSARLKLSTIIQSAAQLNEPVSQIVDRLKKFEPLGLKLPKFNVDLKALDEFIADEKNTIAVSERLNGTMPLLKGKVHPTKIVIAACELNEPVPITLERMRRFAHLFDFTLPAGEPDSWTLDNLRYPEE